MGIRRRSKDVYRGYHLYSAQEDGRRSLANPALRIINNCAILAELEVNTNETDMVLFTRKCKIFSMNQAKAGRGHFTAKTFN